METMIKVWERVLELIKPEVSEVAFNTWFSDIVPLKITENKIYLSVSGPVIETMIKSRYLPLIQNCIQVVLGNLYDVEVVLGQNVESGKSDFEQKEMERNELIPSYINPKYTFESFVVGNSNRFAHAAALAVAETPSTAYNPLFLYGGSGLGKTHLMHAIANYIIKNNPNMSVFYITSESFTNDLINAISNDMRQEFRAKYRNVDVLLVDDIQFIAGKDSTQEEFFHTFNALHQASKQIVLSSDRMPREINTLEERLRTRFEWGLMGDIQPPDFETRIAILKKKAEGEKVSIPYEVLSFMAERIKSNIRELEGSLTRIITYAKISNSGGIDLDLAQEALQDFLMDSAVKRITSKDIKEVVSKYFGVMVNDINSSKRTKNIAYARQTAMYLCRKLTDMSLPSIGRDFGGRDHTTVMHAIEKIKKDINFNKELNLAVENMERDLKSVLK